MREFEIRISSVQDVQAFVALATTQSFPVSVQDSRRQVNGKSFMEMFCLDFHQPLVVAAACTEEEMEIFRTAAQRFLV